MFAPNMSRAMRNGTLSNANEAANYQSNKTNANGVANQPNGNEVETEKFQSTVEDKMWQEWRDQHFPKMFAALTSNREARPVSNLMLAQSSSVCWYFANLSNRQTKTDLLSRACVVRVWVTLFKRDNSADFAWDPRTFVMTRLPHASFLFMGLTRKSRRTGKKSIVLSSPNTRFSRPAICWNTAT